MSEPQDQMHARVTKLEESLAFAERNAEGATEQILDLDRKVRDLVQRLQRLEQALGLVRERVSELAQHDDKNTESQRHGEENQ